MTKGLISSGTPAEKAVGFSRAVVEDGWIFVAGTTGFDWVTMTISDDLSEQVHQIFRNITFVLTQAGASLADVVRANYIVQRLEDWTAMVPLLAHYFGEIRPASTAIIAGLVDPRMKVEIEVTAKQRRSN